MKKNIFFITLTFVLQVFNINVFCQQRINTEEINITKSSPLQAIGRILIDSVSTTVSDLEIGTTNNLNFKLKENKKINIVQSGGGFEFQMGGGLNQPFSLYFPLRMIGGVNRIVSANNLSLAGGDRKESQANLFLSTNGRVGIGTTNPSAVLNVVGDVNIDNSVLNIKDSEDINIRIGQVMYSTTTDTLWYKGILTTTNNGMSLGVNNICSGY